MITKYLLRNLLLLLLVALGACSKYSKLLKNGTVEQKYDAALEYYKNADYVKAGTLFEEIAPQLTGKDALKAELATFYNGYCQYHQGLYNMSAYLFKNFYDTYQRSEHAQEALYMHAYSLFKDSPKPSLDQTSTLSAISALQDFINTYPDSPFREEATKYILELRDKLEQKSYDKVLAYYRTSEDNIANYRSSVISINNFNKEFPDSKYKEDLAFLRVDAQYHLAMLSFLDKQKERYQDVTKFYLELVDKYPNHKKIKQAEKWYETAQKELSAIAEREKTEKEAKAKAIADAKAKADETSKMSTAEQKEN